MIYYFDMRTVFGVDQLFIRRGKERKIILIIDKVVDKFLLSPEKGADTDLLKIDTTGIQARGL